MAFISPAYAEETDTQPVSSATQTTTSAADASLPAPPSSQFSAFLPLLVIFCIFYFLLIRPQHKKMKAHTQMLGTLKKGSKVTTSGGIIGTITKLHADGKIIDVEIASGVIVQVLKHTVTEQADSTPSAKEPSAKALNPSKPKKAHK